MVEAWTSSESGSRVRRTPSGVISKAHARTTATGKPRMAAMTTARSVQPGSRSTGKVATLTWMMSQATMR